MSRLLRRLLVATLLVASTLVVAEGLDDVHDIDMVRVSSNDGQVFLYLVLDPGQRPEDAAVIEKVRNKLNIYRLYVTRGLLWKDEPKADRRRPVVLTVVVTEPLMPPSVAALESLRPMYDRAPTAFAYEHLELKKGP